MRCSHNYRSVASVVILLISAISLASCGSGERSFDMQALPGTHQPVQDYSGSAYQSPNYHPYETFSNIYAWDGTVYIGGDLEPQETLRRVFHQNGIDYFMGTSRDGVGVDRLKDYETDLITSDGTVFSVLSEDGFFPFVTAPQLIVADGFGINDTIHGDALRSAVRILNDVLPPEFQIAVWSEPSGPYDPNGTILVKAMPSAQIQLECSTAAAACASARISLGHTQHATVRIPNDFDARDYRYAQSAVIHELLHALGIWGHVDHIEFPDSLMGRTGEFFPNPGFVLNRIDREILQVMYMSQISSRYNNWEEWSDTRFHFLARTEDESVNFGVALFNGLPQPWGRGDEPGVPLADNSVLNGRVSWMGRLLGFSGVSPIFGDVVLDVSLSRLDEPQRLRFRDILFFNRLGDDDQWFPTRNLDYTVDIIGNGFWHSSEEGQIAGSFLGERHEGMAGTIKRTDLVGAFGGNR